MHPRILESQYRSVILIRNVWTKIFKSATDSLLFNQILYWSTEDKKGNTRLRVMKEGHLWIAKSYDEWAEEIYLPYGTVRDAITRLCNIGLIHKDNFVFGGLKKMHIRIDWAVYERLLQEDFDNNFPEEFRNADIETPLTKAVTTTSETPKAKNTKEVISFTQSDFDRAVAAWNDNRQELPEAQTLTDTRKRKIQKYFKEYGVEKTIELITKATKSVATNPWWNGENSQKKKYNLDNLFNNDKVVTYAESYDTTAPKTKLDQVKDNYAASQQLDY